MARLSTQQIQTLLDTGNWEIVHFTSKSYVGVYYYVRCKLKDHFYPVYYFNKQIFNNLIKLGYTHIKL